MKGSVYTVAFAAILGCTCATLLTAVSQFTEPFRKANALAEEKRNVLVALNIPFDDGLSPKELLGEYEKNVKEETKGELEYFRYMSPSDPNKVEAVAVRFAGPGLWASIKGFLALEADMKTIRGITFYEQEETPGLGAEIAEEPFRNQFKGKTIHDKSGRNGIVIKAGANAAAGNEIEGITGATMTCDKVEQMLNAVIEKIAKDTKSR